ncbi:MAG TPA: hypothetical protein VK742_09835 [Candidatus Sulfotelmatobacter sp.]|nr:hypothetical protein [Candidatus Sulfotelmatobacter sp.]
MNDNDPTNMPPTIAAIPERTPPAALDASKPLSWWLRKIFECNPFYLVSAALLLFGCYRVSIDAPMLNWETARVLFNFFSVQVYEILLVFTAIFLARRKIWYDSTLLVGLENLLVFVPFILISLAALIDPGMAVQMCLVGAAAAVLRFGGLKKFFTQLNLPPEALKIGAVMLSLNVVLPLLYRHFGQAKVGLLSSGAVYEMNEATWLLILPAALALVNFLPRGGAVGDLPPQRRWLPLGMYALWLAVTGTHVYTLDYVYQFEFRPELFAPCAWVLAWTVYRRFGNNDFLPKFLLMVPPAVTPLVAFASPSNNTFFILTALNVAAYLAVCILNRQNRLARHLLSGTVLLLGIGLPETWQQFLAPGLMRAHWVDAGLVLYLLFCTALSRNPKLAIFGSLVLGGSLVALFNDYAGASYWAVQGAFVFFLMHSLRWNDDEHHGAKMVRMLACIVWVGHAFAWMNSGPGHGWGACLSGATVLGGFYILQICFRQRGPFIVPAAAVVVILCGPCVSLVDDVRSLPAGLLAFIGSLMLFTLGTVVALTRHLWHKHPQADDPGLSPKP